MKITITDANGQERDVTFSDIVGPGPDGPGWRELATIPAPDLTIRP